MVSIYVLLLLIIFCTATSKQNSETEISGRQRRFLLYPQGSTHKVQEHLHKIRLVIHCFLHLDEQVITGVGLPVDLERETAIVGIVFKANYLLPQNISDITQTTIYAKKKRSLSRWDIYNVLSHAAEMRGLPGRPCVLRAICEVADTPVDTEYGLFDEILHKIFTPTSTDEELDHHTNNEYYAAQNLGSKAEGICHRHFPECPSSLVDLITRYLP